MNRDTRDRRLPNATLNVPPSLDIATLEAAAEALSRHHEIQHAIALWAIALRLRQEVTQWPVT